MFAARALPSDAQAQVPSHPGGQAGVRELFVAQCATCHGETGDGKGPTLLDRPARSFLAGGFSYGNTPEAVLRTITFGIPGSRMPSFESALGEADRKALAAYVIGLGPPELRVAPGESVLVVRERALVARGKLPALADGGTEIPRGLLIGLPSGLSFEYDAAGLRLLAVRSGEFVDRTDWCGRGGTALQPLGRLVRAVNATPFAFVCGEDACSSRLVATTVRGDQVAIEFDLVARGASGVSTAVARIEEIPRPFHCALGAGWERAFAFHGSTLGRGEHRRIVQLNLPGTRRFDRSMPPGSSRPSNDRGVVSLVPTSNPDRYDVLCVRPRVSCWLGLNEIIAEGRNARFAVVEVPDVELLGPDDTRFERAIAGLLETR